MCRYNTSHTLFAPEYLKEDEWVSVNSRQVLDCAWEVLLTSNNSNAIHMHIYIFYFTNNNSKRIAESFVSRAAAFSTPPFFFLIFISRSFSILTLAALLSRFDRLSFYVRFSWNIYYLHWKINFKTIIINKNNSQRLSKLNQMFLKTSVFSL